MDPVDPHCFWWSDLHSTFLGDPDSTYSASGLADEVTAAQLLWEERA